MGKTAFPPQTFERFVGVISLLAIGVSCVLAFWQLDMMGLTWDESGDYDLTSTLLRELNFISNRQDPSQGRLSHLVAMVSFALFGQSYFTFKLPFVIIGLGTGLGLWLFLRGQVSATLAALFTALYFSCPFVLAASRTAATAGDVLVLALTLAFIVTLHAWVRAGSFWPYGALSGAACGAATGTKWTCGLLIIAVVAFQLGRCYRSRKTLAYGQTWTELLAFQALAAAVAIAANPTFLNGLPFVLDALKDSHSYDHLRMIYLGEVRSRPPWYYIPALFVSKFSPPIVITFLLAGAQALALRIRVGSWGILRAICLLSLVPILPLAAKGFQNAHYYVGAIPAVLILSALLVDRWVQKASRSWRLGLELTTSVVVLSQVLLLLWLAPDFLQAGRQYGQLFQGQFSGPAVNHCQGSPLAIMDINHLVKSGRSKIVYQLDSCGPVFAHAVENGPVPPMVPISIYPRNRPKIVHYLLVNASYLYDSTNESMYMRRVTQKRRATDHCKLVVSHTAYTIYECEA